MLIRGIHKQLMLTCVVCITSQKLYWCPTRPVAKLHSTRIYNVVGICHGELMWHSILRMTQIYQDLHFENHEANHGHWAGGLPIWCSICVKLNWFANCGFEFVNRPQTKAAWKLLDMCGQTFLVQCLLSCLQMLLKPLFGARYVTGESQQTQL